MKSCKILIIIFPVLFVSCAGRGRLLKEIERDSPHGGHLFKLSENVIEVVELPEKRLKFYFYELKDKELDPIDPRLVSLRNGVFDPKSTKIDFSIDFIPHKSHIEGFVGQYDFSQTESATILVEVRIGEKSRLIRIPLNPPQKK